MLTYSSRELQDSGRDFLNYVGNDRLLRYLTDENEITLLVNLYKTELLILSLPVYTGVEYDFKRVLLIDEEDTETMVLVYQEELLLSNGFKAFVGDRHAVKNIREGLFETAVNVYLDCLDDLKRKYGSIENHVVEEKYVDENIISIMKYDTILQKALPNIEGIGLLVEGLNERVDPGDISMVNRLNSLKVELVQIRGMVMGLSQLGENISHTIDSINNYMLNRVMRTLTILTVCIAIPTLIAGLYGMNVPLPFQEFEWVMQLISLVSLLIIVVVLLVFKRRRYF